VNNEKEQAELKDLHRLAALELAANGEQLTVWAGGDAPNQQDTLIRLFTQRFPDVPLHLTVDLSKYHDIKVYQGLLDGCLEPDVVMLQTMNDFENWKAMDALEPFTPKGFGNIIPGYSDIEGYYLGVYIFCFVPQYAKYGLKEIPTRYADFLKPEYKNRLVLTPPHDDDAVLFVYDRIIRRHGMQFLIKLAEQRPRFIRGTAAPAELVGRQGFVGNITGYMTSPDDPSVSFIPEGDDFVSWPQRAAMFRLTRHKAAARLLLAYLTSYEFQAALGTWSVRDDVAPPAGMKPLGEYANTNPLDFIEWMRDRKHLNGLRIQMCELFGPVQGQSPLTDPALLRLYRK
jgi:ABC-type Fe3+ transport system substrate-binding protein